MITPEQRIKLDEWKKTNNIQPTTTSKTSSYNLIDQKLAERGVPKVQPQTTGLVAPGADSLQKSGGIAGDYLGNVWNDYYNYANELMHPIKSFVEPNQAPGVGTVRQTAGTASKIFSDTLGTIFAPITEGISSAIKPLGISKESPLNPVAQGTVIGSAVAGPWGAVGGAAFGAAQAGVNMIMEQPKIKSFLDANPDVRNDINALMVAIPAVLGGKAGEDVLNKPISKAIPEMSKNVVNTVVQPVKGAIPLANSLAKFATSQGTGMSPETISRIISNPEDFSPEAMKTFTREGIAQEATNNINKRLADLSETGKEYETIRQNPQHIEIPEKIVQDVLDKYKIKVGKDGKLNFDKESVSTSPGDRRAIQDWYTMYGQDAIQTPNSFLNARKGLDNLAEWDATKTDASNIFAMDLRKQFDTAGKQSIPGLSELDAKYAPEVEALNKIKKDYFNPDGTLKDNAVSKMANLSNKGREQVLGRLEQVSPGIGEKIITLKAVEDIHNAMGQKVGTYIRAGVVGGGILTMNIPAIITAILSEPKIATQILKGYGKALGVKDTIIEKIINNYETAKKNVNKK